MNYSRVNDILEKSLGKGKAWVIPASEELQAQGFEYCLQLEDTASDELIQQAAEIVNSIEPTEWAYDKMTRV